ncbi:MAG: AAA family ATPase [Tepidisphaeraceae bacterium]
MRTIAIINQKGGCGKTTTAINLAACLARMGQKTLLLDMDPQGHCAVGLAVPEEQIERSILDVLIEPQDQGHYGLGKPAQLNEVVWQIATDFDLAPSNIRLSAFEQLFAGRPGREDRLAKALATVQDNYAWCIIDCPPSVGLITFNALRLRRSRGARRDRLLQPARPCEDDGNARRDARALRPADQHPRPPDALRHPHQAGPRSAQRVAGEVP